MKADVKWEILPEFGKKRLFRLGLGTLRSSSERWGGVTLLKYLKINKRKFKMKREPVKGSQDGGEIWSNLWGPVRR